MTYDWLDDDGRLWFPESKAFWLEPETEAQLLAWFRRHRPAFRGTVTAAGMTIEVGYPPPVKIGLYWPIHEPYGLMWQNYTQPMIYGVQTHRPRTSWLGGALGILL